MDKVYRMIDANLNRISEGLRVLEDIARFTMDNKHTSKKIRELRHKVRKTFDVENLIISRNIISDVGIETTKNSKLDFKSDIKQLILSNYKRVQEGLRVVEDSLKILDYNLESKIYEEIRYESYKLEKDMILSKYPQESQLYLILGEKFSDGRTNEYVLKEALEAGVKIIQYREKEKNKRDKLEECKKLLEITKEHNAIFIVNDDLDIALAIKADGIHLGQEDMLVTDARRIAPNMIIGVSTHNINQAIEAEKLGADYLGVGPMFVTSTKKNIEHSKGVEFLYEVSKKISIPYVAIGGIKESNLDLLLENNLNQYAMISEIVGAVDIKNKIKSIIRKMGK